MKSVSTSTISRNAISLAGEFAVLSQLALKGYDASLTLGNTKNVDILISHATTGKMYRMEVKTTLADRWKDPSDSKLFGYTVCQWIMTDRSEHSYSPNLYYCFVLLAVDLTQSRFFVVPSRLVADYVKKQHRRWLTDRTKHKDTTMRIFRIGSKKHHYSVKPPFAEDYENNWSFRK